MVRCCSCIHAIKMMLSALQRFRRHGLAAARHGQGNVLVRHPQRRERAAHAIESGLQDEREFVRIARAAD